MQVVLYDYNLIFTPSYQICIFLSDSAFGALLLLGKDIEIVHK